MLGEAAQEASGCQPLPSVIHSSAPQSDRDLFKPSSVCGTGPAGLWGPVVNSMLGGKAKQNIEALSEFSPCPRRFLHCMYPKTPTCALWQLLGREKERKPPSGSCHYQPEQTVPPLCSLGLHSDLTRWPG